MMAVEMQNITKSFNGFFANNKISFSVKKGEIHCLLGENGAGKTTLMKILFGLYKPDYGIIKIDEIETHMTSPREAYNLGLGMVHQHFMLINNFSVLDNIILGSEPGKILIDRNESKNTVQSIIDKYNFDIDINEKVSNLSVGMKQRVEIIKTLYKGANIIILDEPTAVLTPSEANQLLDILKEMKKEGKTIIFITHKLNETMAVSDRITILRSGKSIKTLETKDITALELARLMVGSNEDFNPIEKKEIALGKTIISFKNVQILQNSTETVSFDIKEGEIFGIAGVEGNGQQEIENLIMGLMPCKKGNIYIKDIDVTEMSVKKRKQFGIGYIPSDRLKYGILPSFSLEDNFLLGNQFNIYYCKNGIIDYKHGPTPPSLLCTAN